MDCATAPRAARRVGVRLGDTGKFNPKDSHAGTRQMTPVDLNLRCGNVKKLKNSSRKTHGNNFYLDSYSTLDSTNVKI